MEAHAEYIMKEAGYEVCKRRHLLIWYLLGVWSDASNTPVMFSAYLLYITGSDGSFLKFRSCPDIQKPF